MKLLSVCIDGWSIGLRTDVGEMYSIHLADTNLLVWSVCLQITYVFLETHTLLTPWYLRYSMLCEQRMLWGTLVYLPVGWENSLHIAHCKYSPHAGLFIDKQSGLFIIVETSLRTAGGHDLHPFPKCYRLTKQCYLLPANVQRYQEVFWSFEMKWSVIRHLEARNLNVSISDLIFISHCCHLQVS